MGEKWTLTQGVKKLFSVDSEGETETDDLVTLGRQMTLDISFAEIETKEINGVKVEPTKGLSVILTADIPLPFDLDDEGIWMFSQAIFPADGETLPDLVQRIAQCLGVKPEERIWEDGNS